MQISEASPQDIPALVKFVNDIYRGDEGKRGWTTEAGSIGGQRTDETMLSEDLARGSILIAREAEQIVGCVYMDLFQPKAAYFGMLTIAPARQSSGLGRRLLERVESHAREKGALRLECWVYAFRDTLIAWYERRGFQKTGERLATTGDPKYGIPKIDDPHLLRLGKPL